MSLPESAREFLAGQAQRVRELNKTPNKKKKIVFPEGDDPRVQEAAARLVAEGLVDPVLLNGPAEGALAGRRVAPGSDARLSKYAALLYDRRRAKGMTQIEALDFAKRPLYFGCLMVAAGDADGFVGGAVNSTAATARAALQTIGSAPAVKTVSTFMILCVQDRSYGHHGLLAIADPAMVVEPSATELADIAIATAGSVKALFGIEPAVALLSFSTKGSGPHKESDKVVEALRVVKERAPQLHIDGELQADAALVAQVGERKAPGSTVAGKANTLIFPDINSANISYKMVERLGGAAAIGPFLQGLAKPANDLSRGCSASDIYGVALVTALQAEAACQ